MTSTHDMTASHTHSHHTHQMVHLHLGMAQTRLADCECTSLHPAAGQSVVCARHPVGRSEHEIGSSYTCSMENTLNPSLPSPPLPLSSSHPSPGTSFSRSPCACNWLLKLINSASVNLARSALLSRLSAAFTSRSAFLCFFDELEPCPFFLGMSKWEWIWDRRTTWTTLKTWLVPQTSRALTARLERTLGDTVYFPGRFGHTAVRTGRPETISPGSGRCT